MSRIVLHTFGSLGDLHPYLAIGAELRARGHDVVLATHDTYRATVTAAGLGFAPVRPDLDPDADLESLMRRAMDLRRGSEFVLRAMVLEPLADSLADLLAAFAGADLAVTHVLSVAAVTAAEKLGVPRVHSVLQPFAMWSAHDLPRFPSLPGSRFLRHAPLAWRRALYASARAWTAPWFAPLHALRADLGLPRLAAHPVLEMGSPLGNLALFSPRFGAPQPDWPAHTIATGFPEWTSTLGWDERLEAFLDRGEPPIVFTLGSSAVHAAGDFWPEAVAAARALNRRAVVLTGHEVRGRHAPPPAGDDVLALPFAPHAALFPRAAAVVHQGGIGTTARALAAGRPMLVVPWSHDQPDNAARCERLGVARVLSRARFRATPAARALAALLADRACADRAAALGDAIRAERGAARAADAIEDVLAGRAVRAAAPLVSPASGA